MLDKVPRLTKEQAAIIGAYTGITCGPFGDVQEYVEKILDRPVWTHEFADKELSKEIKKKSKPDFIAMCHEREPNDR
jgi:hypothetical protein